MRFIGLTLALLASSLGARADSAEERVGALEARVKALEAALNDQPGKAAALPAAVEKSEGAYEIAGQRVIHSADGKADTAP
jgi:hypothetical protein